MRRNGHKALAIHGDKSQPERDAVLTEFRNGATTILIATDVAARGLDVEDVKFVVNFDYPNSSEDYIHRIGEHIFCILEKFLLFICLFPGTNITLVIVKIFNVTGNKIAYCMLHIFF